MRINVYSQELLTDPRGDAPLTDGEQYHPVIELVEQKSNTGLTYSAVRLFLHSSERLHHPPMDDDRSAITFWLPQSRDRRNAFARSLRELADLVSAARDETGLD